VYIVKKVKRLVAKFIDLSDKEQDLKGRNVDVEVK
jgi:hypothetical protein